MNYRNLDETIELGTVEQEENELPVLPRDVYQVIAENITDANTLRNFMLANKMCREAVRRSLGAQQVIQRAREESLTVRRMRQMWDRINSPRSVLVRILLKVLVVFAFLSIGAICLGIFIAPALLGGLLLHACLVDPKTLVANCERPSVMLDVLTALSALMLVTQLFVILWITSTVLDDPARSPTARTVGRAIKIIMWILWFGVAAAAGLSFATLFVHQKCTSSLAAEAQGFVFALLFSFATSAIRYGACCW